MSESEIHQLIANSRAEFDIATIFFVLINLAFMFFAASKKHLEPFQVRWLSISCGVISAFIILRIAAAMVRFGYQTLLLESMNPDYTHTFIPLQAPTLIGRLTILFGLPILSILFLRKSIKQ